MKHWNPIFYALICVRFWHELLLLVEPLELSFLCFNSCVLKMMFWDLCFENGVLTLVSCKWCFEMCVLKVVCVCGHLCLENDVLKFVCWNGVWTFVSWKWSLKAWQIKYFDNILGEKYFEEFSLKASPVKNLFFFRSFLWAHALLGRTLRIFFGFHFIKGPIWRKPFFKGDIGKSNFLHLNLCSILTYEFWLLVEPLELPQAQSQTFFEKEKHI